MSEPTADCMHSRVVPLHGILAPTPASMPRCRQVGTLSEPTADCTVAAQVTPKIISPDVHLQVAGRKSGHFLPPQAGNQEMGGAHGTGMFGPIVNTQPLCRKVGALSEPTAVRTKPEGGVSVADLEVTCPSIPAGPSKASSGMNMLSDLRATIASQIPLRPAWMAGQQFSPPLSYACLSVPPPEDTTRRFYTIFEPRLDHRQRPADEAWRLIDFITDAVRQVSDRVRLVYLITRPLGGFAAPQLVLTLASAPPRHRSVPIGGLVHTIEVCFPSPILSIWASLHHKGLDLTGEWETAHAQGLLYVLDQDGNEIEGWAETDDGPEWAELRARPGPWRQRRIPYGQEAYAGAPLSTTSTTATEASPDPPSLLHVRGSRQRPPSCAVPDALPFEVQPAQLAQTRVRALPASCLHLAQSVGGGLGQIGTFTVFCDMSEPQFIAADAAWTVDQYLRTAAAHAESCPRLIRVINVPLPGLPTPQLTVTTNAAEEGSVTLPLDARDLGGDIFAITIGPNATSGGVLDALVQISPDLAPALQALHAVDGVFLQDDLGQVWDSVPSSFAATQWLKVRRDARVPPLLGTTVSTTAAPASLPEPMVVFVLAGGGTLLRLAPQRVSEINLSASLTDLLMLLAIHGRLPQQPVVTVAAAMPRAAATPNVYTIGFVVVELQRADSEVVVLQDPSLDGSLLMALTVDRGTQADGLLAPAQLRRGYTAAVNGSPIQGCRRSLITGDLVQLYQGPLAARVWTAAHMYQVIPALRLFALPIRVPGLRSFVQGDMSYASRLRTRQYLFEAIEIRQLEQVMDLGEPGARSHPYVVLGPEHLPMLVYVPGDEAPSDNQVQCFLTYSGIFTPGSHYIITTATSGACPVVVSVPPRDHLMTILYPAPDESHSLLQLSVPPECNLPALQLPLRSGMELVFPRLAHAAVIGERHARAASSSRGGAAMSLLQTKVRYLTHDGPKHRVQVPTPLGRRTLACPAKADNLDTIADRTGSNSLHRQGPEPARPSPCQLELEQLLPRPETHVAWAVNDDIVSSCLADHPLHNLHTTLEPLASEFQPFTVAWRQLPLWDPTRLEELCIYTDGSFFPHRERATWALVVIGRIDGVFYRIGFHAGSVRAAHCAELSAYQGEVEALLHAAAIVCANPGPLPYIGCDCSAALLAVQGHGVLSRDNDAGRALTGLTCYAQGVGRPISFNKVEAHSGCAFNDMADALAKQVGRLDGCSPWPFAPEDFYAAVSEQVVERLWLTCPSNQPMPDVPPLTASGTWTSDHMTPTCRVECHSHRNGST